MKKMVFLLLAAVFAVNSGLMNVHAADFSTVPESRVEVLSEGLNLRSGPGVGYSVIKEMLKGASMSVLGKISDWYLVQLEDGTIGMVYSEYVKITQISRMAPEEGAVSESSEADMPMAEGNDEAQLFGFTNKSRIENGLQPFAWDENLNNIARLKGEDMVNNDYFDHFSPTYGTPFKMLKEMGVAYKGASENLLSNRDMETAHSVLMGSPAHRGNLLSPRFNKMGVAVVESRRYGKIIVQLFVEE